MKLYTPVNHQIDVNYVQIDRIASLGCLNEKGAVSDKRVMNVSTQNVIFLDNG